MHVYVLLQYSSQSASVWVRASPEDKVGWDPQSQGLVLGRSGAVRSGKALLPAVPSEHSSLCLSVGEYRLLWHLQGYRGWRVSTCCIQDKCSEIVFDVMRTERGVSLGKYQCK